jgi:antitoxin component of RelBE/YafQ-DinJ toxin-antitoxin module
LKIKRLNARDSSHLYRRKNMITPLTRKNEYHDNICEELLRERAAVLSRAGIAVSEAIDILKRWNKEIKEKAVFLEALNHDTNIREAEQNIKTIREEINLIIEKFNIACRKAQLQYYYLIVTREAMGLRSHDRVCEIYVIPDEKKKIKVV